MKNLITFSVLVFSIMIFSSISLYAQYGWFQQYSPTSDPLGGVYFIDENTGFAVDQWYGKIMKTTNGGTNWTINSSFVCGLHKLCFINKDTGTIVGASGTILFTTNSGTEWIVKYSGTNANLNKIRFVKTNTGYTSTGFIVGINGIILKTNNYGFTWCSQNSTTNHYLYGVYFIDMSTGYIVGQTGYQSGQSTILKTTNGGCIWTNISPGLSKTLTGVCFINPNTGVVVGGSGYYDDGIILRTVDGGNNWQTVLTTPSAFHNLDYLNNVMTAVGNDGLILRSTDGGSTWIMQGTPTTTLLKDVSFINKNTGWAVGHGGVILKTTTGGSVNISNYSNSIPNDYKLYQNFPNPFNPSTKIRFDIPKSSYTKIIVYSNLGKIVSELVNEKLNAGSYEVNWNPKSVSSGIYFYRLETEEFSDVKKMLFIK